MMRLPSNSATVNHRSVAGRSKTTNLRNHANAFLTGSVGFAYRHDQQKGATFRADPWAEYAVLTVVGERIALEFRRVPYDAVQMMAVYQSSDRPFADEASGQYSSS